MQEDLTDEAGTPNATSKLPPGVATAALATGEGDQRELDEEEEEQEKGEKDKDKSQVLDSFSPVVLLPFSFVCMVDVFNNERPFLSDAFSDRGVLIQLASEERPVVSLLFKLYPHWLRHPYVKPKTRHIYLLLQALLIGKISYKFA